MHYLYLLVYLKSEHFVRKIDSGICLFNDRKLYIDDTTDSRCYFYEESSIFVNIPLKYSYFNNIAHKRAKKLHFMITWSA